MRSWRPSITRRIALGFALVLSVSAFVVVVSFLQHERTGRALTLIDDGYLPLALTVSEARATQQVINNLLDRAPTERDPTASRAWLQTARSARPETLRKARAKITQIHGMITWETEGAALVRLRRELRKLQQMIARGEPRYADLYAALDKGDREAAGRTLADVRARERAIDREWERIWSEIVARIDATNQLVTAQQRQAFAVFGVLAGLALVVGILAVWWSQRVLSPLPRLQERVEAVARGEFVEQLGPTTDDEIGRLSNEFERMVKALVARDQSLGEAQTRLIQSERLAAIGRMAAHVSHEVRNPLSSIGLNVELLEESLSSADRETRDLLGAIHREIERLRLVTEEYLRVARLPNPHLVPEYIPDVVRGAVQLLRIELEQAGVELDLRLAEDLPLVALDEAQIRQVLINLLKNAHEAMPEGGRIELEARTGDGGVELVVRDYGLGMDGEQKERIFDLFYTTKQRGSGLGLPLTQQIVVAHRGHIRCESSPGKGTTFTLWFPAAKSERAGRDAMVAEE
jgi:two-component system NtrC family sensor kinase